MFYVLSNSAGMNIGDITIWEVGRRRGLFLKTSMFGTFNPIQWPWKFDKYLHRLT